MSDADAASARRSEHFTISISLPRTLGSPASVALRRDGWWPHRGSFSDLLALRHVAPADVGAVVAEFWEQADRWQPPRPYPLPPG